MLIRDLGDEVVVYELESHRGHCLNRTAALVWRACDGRRSMAGIAAQLGRALGLPPDEDLVRYTIRRLRGARLLDAGSQMTPTLTRRELARRIGQAAVLPVVVSLLAPRPAEAAGTCRDGIDCVPPGAVCNCDSGGADHGKSCWNGSDCSSYVCCGSVCKAPPC